MEYKRKEKDKALQINLRKCVTLKFPLPTTRGVRKQPKRRSSFMHGFASFGLPHGTLSHPATEAKSQRTELRATSPEGHGHPCIVPGEQWQQKFGHFCYLWCAFLQ